MTTEELAKEFTEREIRYTNRRGTEEDIQRLNEINQYLRTEYDDYGYKRFADLVERESFGISLTTFRTLEEGMEKMVQSEISGNSTIFKSKSNDLTVDAREINPPLYNNVIIEEIKLTEFKPIIFEEPKKTTIEEDIKMATENVKVDNSQFLFDYDSIDDAPVKEERKRLTDKLKETFGKVANGVKGISSKLIAEAMKPLKEQVNSLQEQVVSVTEQANKQIESLQNQLNAVKENANQRINNLQKQITTLRDFFTAELNKVTEKVSQLTEKGRAAQERITDLTEKYEKLVSQNATLQRQYSDKSGTENVGVSYNTNTNKFQSMDSKIISLQEMLQEETNKRMDLEKKIDNIDKRESVLNKFMKAKDMKTASLEEVALAGGEAIKDIMSVHKAAVYCIDPIKNAPYKVNEHNEREYTNINTNIEQAINSGEPVIDNNSIIKSAIVPFKVKDENNIEKVMGYVELSDFTNIDETFAVESVNAATTLFADKVQAEYQKTVLTKDPLTNFYNKEGISAILDSKIYDDIQNKIPVAAIKLAVDDIGVIGEDAYKHVANLLQETNKDANMTITPSRIGDNDFVVLVEGERRDDPKFVEEQAFKYGQNLCHLIAETPIEYDNGSIAKITASAGVALIEEDMFINKSRDQMSAVFTNVTDKIISERCEEAARDGGNKAIASYDITSEFITEVTEDRTFSVRKEIADFASPLLGKNYQDLAMMQEVNENGVTTVATIEVVGTPIVEFNGTTYNDPNTYPDELVNNLKTHKPFNEYDIKIIKMPELQISIAVYDAPESSQPVYNFSKEWIPSEFNGSVGSIRAELRNDIHKLSMETVRAYEQSIDKSYGNGRENTSADTNEKKNKTDIER